MDKLILMLRLEIKTINLKSSSINLMRWMNYDKKYYLFSKNIDHFFY